MRTLHTRTHAHYSERNSPGWCSRASLPLCSLARGRSWTMFGGLQTPRDLRGVTDAKGLLTALGLPTLCDEFAGKGIVQLSQVTPEALGEMKLSHGMKRKILLALAELVRTGDANARGQTSADDITSACADAMETASSPVVSTADMEGVSAAAADAMQADPTPAAPPVLPPAPDVPPAQQRFANSTSSLYIHSTIVSARTAYVDMAALARSPVPHVAQLPLHAPTLHSSPPARLSSVNPCAGEAGPGACLLLRLPDHTRFDRGCGGEEHRGAYCPQCASSWQHLWALPASRHLHPSWQAQPRRL